MNLEERISKLITLAKKRGFVAYDEFNETFPDKLFLPEQLDEAFSSLRARHIEILEYAPD